MNGLQMVDFGAFMRWVVTTCIHLPGKHHQIHNLNEYGHI